MPLNSIAAVSLFLTLLTHCMEGFDRVTVATRSDWVTYANSDYTNDDIRTARDLGSGSGHCCITGNCSCPSLYSALTNLTSNALINITTDMELSSFVLLANLTNVTITGHNNPSVTCNSFGGLHFVSSSNCTIKGIIWVGCGGKRSINDEDVYAVLQFSNSSNLTINDSTFKHSIGQAIVLSGILGNMNIRYCKFLSNKLYQGHGTAIYYSLNTPNLPLNFMITNCSFSYNERAKSVVYAVHSPTKVICEYLYLQDSKFYFNKGVPVYLMNQNLQIKGNVEFIGNVAEDGGAIYISDHSNVSFHKDTKVIFKVNKVSNNGGAIFLTNHSNILFKDYPVFDHCYNSQVGDTLVALGKKNGKITLIFFGNNAGNFGQDIYAHSSNITISNMADIAFIGNPDDHDKSSVVYTEDHSSITFGGSSTVNFKNYKADEANGGAMYIANSAVTFKGNSAVHFQSNIGAYSNGGAMSVTYGKVTFKENSTVVFLKNYADHGSGGALYVNHHSVISFEGNSSVEFSNNSASFHYGGAMYIDNHCSVRFWENSKVKFYLNHADKGGAIYINTRSTVTLEGNSTVKFYNNIGSDGGAVHVSFGSNAIFKGNSTALFKDNSAINGNGGALYIYYSNVTFKGNSVAKFDSNDAFTNGGVLYAYYGQLYITFEENCTVQMNNNRVSNNGAGIFVNKLATVRFRGHSRITLCNNTAGNDGGAIYTDINSTVRFDQYSAITFNSNSANYGGSMFAKSSEIDIEGNCSVNFTSNVALQDGGAIYLSDNSNFTHYNSSNVQFYYNTASDYGGAIYALLKESTLNFNSTQPGIHFKNNTAGAIRKPIYINVPKSCDSSCFFHNVKLVIKQPLPIATSPNKLLLYNPAKCINGNDAYCDKYYVNNIMLGQEVTFAACVMDYYDQPTEATQFSITEMNHPDYNISNTKYITVSCNRSTQGISVIGNMRSNDSYNYSLTISLYVARVSESKVISLTLTIQLSQCNKYPGFWYSSSTQKCECYNAKTIISCSGSSSTIKRGYWFGSIAGKPTVTHCPSDYCNFTCCDITNGIYHLSPVRANQCRPHRSGNACGECEKGYTLLFDSPDCVDISKCTVGQSALVITLSLLYWVVVIVTVFAMTYFKAAIGSVYAIIYYYSVVDILLSQVSLISSGLHTTVNVMSSLAKLTPQFLGQFCFIRHMSGIDQQFIHYLHPLAVLLILIMISMVARRSHRISKFISRGIIQFICLLLLLSYTAVASTSLLLLRSLKFMDIDEVFTYLSPDIEYFHGRHLVYVIAAITFTLIIVFGLPLLLLLEPLLNSKFNFVKIKPLLDQFQGCYRDNFRCFAGYYMVCRLVIIFLVIIKISDEFTTQYLLISTCALMQLIHVLVKPYASVTLNVFDGIILQLIVIISVLPVVEFVDDYNKTLVLVIGYFLVIFPLTAFAIMKFWTNKKNIQNGLIYLGRKFTYKYNALSNDDDDDDDGDDGEHPIAVKQIHCDNNDKMENKIHKIPTTTIVDV